MPNDFAPAVDGGAASGAPSMDDYAAARTATTESSSPAESGGASPATPATPAQDFADSGNADATPNTPANPAAVPNEPKKPNGYQRRINELRAQSAAHEREKNLLLETLRAQTMRTAQPDAQPAAKPEDARPTEEQYPGDYRAFLRAEAAFEARQSTKAVLEQDREARARESHELAQRGEQETAARQVIGVMQDFAGRNDEYRAQNPDFEQSADALDAIEITPQNRPMIEAIMLRPDSARLLHHLGRNIQVAHYIARLAPGLQQTALGEFAAAVSNRRHSAAPPAGAPVGARSAGSSSLPAGGSMDDYAAARQAHFKG